MIETVATMTVYHGGKEGVTGTPRCPFFVTPEIKMAATYATDRGAWDGHHGYITQYTFKPRKIAQVEDIESVVLSLGHDEDDISQTKPFDYISPPVHHQADEIIAKLVEQGFDCATSWDFGMDCPFTEYQAYCVFDPSILTFEAVIPLEDEG
jgi:hypothetical protein